MNMNTMSGLFHSTRLRLTALHLLIIMSISVTFSVVIYQRFSAEISRISLYQQTRPEFLEFDPTIFAQARERTIVNLFVINGFILFVSGGLGYALAGKILEPIDQAIQDQNRFTADASHELRTPLTALKTELEVALRDKRMTLAQARELLASNLEEVNKLRSLSDALLLLARQRDKKELTEFASSVSLLEIIQSAIKKVSPLAEQKEIDINHDARDAKLRGDAIALENLFVILLDNAIKYSHKKSTVSVATVVREKYFSLSVKDSGIGIKKEDLPHIFDRFYRADQARTKKDAGGYGLGLSIAQHIVEQHRGKISVASAPDQGATFTVVLPIPR